MRFWPYKTAIKAGARHETIHAFWYPDHGSFWLPTSKDKLYPNFVAMLSDERTLVVEYKGEPLASANDAQEKQNIGSLWAAKSDGKALFIMAGKKDGQGRDVHRQIQDAISRR